MLVSVDPGYKDCGVAIFADGKLVVADHVKSPATALVDAVQFSETARAVLSFVERAQETVDELGPLSLTELAVEYPQQYAMSPAPRESVQRLVGVIGALVSQVQGSTSGLSVRVSTYKPREWKGQVPKEIMNERVLSRLTDAEVLRMAALSKTRRHNMLDAVGIGLHHLGRLKRRVYINSKVDGASLG